MTNSRTSLLQIRRCGVLFKLALASLLVCTISCDGSLDQISRQEASLTSSSTLSISLPNNETAQRIVLGASAALAISDRARLQETAGGLSTASNVGTEQTQIGVSANIGNLWSAASVFLGSNATVAGFLKLAGSLTKQTGVTIGGTVATTPISTSTTLTSWSVTFPSSGQNFQLQPSQQKTLTPGGYGGLNAASGAQVNVSSGSYFFSSLDLEPNANLVVDETAGPVFIYVRDTFLYKGKITHVGGGVADLLVGCSACSDISLQGSFQGTLVAPSANVTLTTVTGGHAGAFFARRITVNPDTTVTHQTFRHWDLLASPACLAATIAPVQQGPFTLCNSGEVGHLAPAISAEDSGRIRDAFKWPQSRTVPNFGADGNPTLWYARIYVEDKTDIQALDDLEIHWDTMPLFDVERDQWAGQSGVTTPTFDGQGGFVFAVIPGISYNLIRDAALCADPAQAIQVFRVVQLQDVPIPDARNADGSLSYQYLAAQGFRYRGLPNCPDDLVPQDSTLPEAACDSPFLNPSAGGDPVLNALESTSTGSGLSIACAPDSAGQNNIQQMWGFHIGRLVKRFTKTVVNIVHGASDLARKGLAAASRFFKGSTTLTVNLEVRNSDPGFGGGDTLMLRSWGAKRGTPVPLSGVQVRALQQITFNIHAIPSVTIPGTSIRTPSIVVPRIAGTIPFDSLSTATSNTSGVASMKVVKSSTTGICVRLKNQAAEFDDWISVEERCSFKNPILSASDLNGPKTITVPLAGDLVNTMAQITDAHDYLHDVMGYTPKAAQVLTGFFANKLNKDGRAYTPCFGYADTSAILGDIGGQLGAVGGAFAGNKVETFLKDAANLASEQFDAWSDAGNKWAAARAKAAATAAAQAVSSAADAVNSARDAAQNSRQAVAVAAEAAATVTEAAKKIARLQAQVGTPQQALDQANQALVAATNDLNTAVNLAKQAQQQAIAADSQALNAVASAALVAPNTAAALSVALAAESSRVAGAFSSVVGDVLARASGAILPILGKAAGEILGFIIGEVSDVVFGDVDMVLPAGDSTVSRGVASHEYGHFSFCDMTYRDDPGKFASAWVNTAVDTIVTQVLKRDGSQVEDYYFNEGIADFFAAQTAGGVNYFRPIGSSAANVANWIDPMGWCRTGSGIANQLRCVEDNFGAIPSGTTAPSPNIAGTPLPKQITGLFRDASGNPFPLADQVARVASILHDAFDGEPSAIAQNVPDNGVAWVFDASSSTFRAPTPPFTSSSGFFAPLGSLNDTIESPATAIFHEENVELPGSAFPLVVAQWLQREPPFPDAGLRQQTFLQGLTQVMSSEGVQDDEVCRLYELHQPSDACPSWGPPPVILPPPPE